MISIIISSYKQADFEQVALSIKKTIGVPYEIIKVDNPGLYGLCQAYNIGAEKANYEILCFIHEDIIFHTVNWGKNVLNHFEKNADLGLIGVAGTTCITSLPTGWAQNTEDVKMNIIQCLNAHPKTKLSTYKGVNVEYVKALDGVFLAMKRKTWNEIRFDENIKGFHVYDIDFSLRTAQKYRVAVVYDILLEHNSIGVYGSNAWVDATISFYKNKEKKHLFDKRANSTGIRTTYYLRLQHNNISFIKRVKYIIHLGISGKSIFHATVFLLPGPGRFLHSLQNTFRRFFPKQK